MIRNWEKGKQKKKGAEQPILNKINMPDSML